MTRRPIFPAGRFTPDPANEAAYALHRRRPSQTY